METKKSKTSARDFFFHAAVIVLLYAGAIALLNLLFRIINTAFPQPNWGFTGSISFPVAALIVVFPLLIVLSWFLRKDYERNPAKKDYAFRKWLIYITLFIAGGVLSGDLITLFYYFLDGRELTTAFILKVLSVFVVALGIFGYFLDDLKDRLTSRRAKIWLAGSSAIVLVSLILGFAIMGTPRDQRLNKYDSQKISDLQSIQWQVVNYWQQKGRLPDDLEGLKDPISGFLPPKDQQTGEDYGYEVIDELSFGICAEFNRASPGARVSAVPIYPELPLSSRTDETWRHEAGYHCFERTIDPDLYPRKIPQGPP